MQKILIILFFIFSSSYASLERVTLQLEWKYQFEFAGFIAAKEKGFYKDVGLDVELIEYNHSDTVKDVINGKINYGLLNSSFVTKGRDVVPIVMLATYFQQSPLIFISQSEIKTPKDFIGKKIMATNFEFISSSLSLFLDHFFINKTNSTFVSHSFKIDDFIEKKVDVLSVFSSNELYELDKRGIKYNIFDPSDYGFITNAVNLFTSKKEALEHSHRTKVLIEATNRGWKYALENVDEIIDIIYNKYSKEKSKDALYFEAEATKKLMLLDLYDIGYVSKELTSRAYKQLQYKNKLDATIDLQDYFFEDLLKKYSKNVDLSREEQQYLETKKEIKFCADPSWLPFEGIENGKHIGIVADIFDIFRTKVSVPLTLLETNSWDESINKAQNRECDIFSLASSTPQRLKYMNFTTPYINLPLVIATKMDKIFIDDIVSIKDKPIGIVKGYAIAEILKNKYNDINIVDVESIEAGLAKVESGELYGYIDNLMVIAINIQKNYTNQLKVSGRLEEKVGLAVGARNDEPILKSIFQKLINNLNEEKKQVIYNKWVVVKESVGYDTSTILKVLAGATLFIFFFLYRYYELQKYNKILQETSITDKLTKLYNRLKLDEVLLEHYLLCKRYNISASIILIDIDNFKKINDAYGHLVGDSVLKEISKLLKEHTRNTDIVGRWGGEEFMIITPGTAYNDALNLAIKLKTEISKYNFTVVGRVTASLGVSSFDENKTIIDIIKESDDALYKAKELGKNQVVGTKN